MYIIQFIYSSSSVCGLECICSGYSSGGSNIVIISNIIILNSAVIVILIIICSISGIFIINTISFAVITMITISLLLYLSLCF